MKRILIIAICCILLFLTGCGISANEESTLKNKAVYLYNTEEKSIGSIYGELYKPEKSGKLPLIIFAHELGASHYSGEDYAEYFAEKGIAFYTFDFRNGGYGSRSGNDMSKMSVATERDDLLAVIKEAKKWDFVDTDNIILLGASQGGFVATMTACETPDDIAGLICIYPAYLIQDDIKSKFSSLDSVPETFDYLGWFTAGKCYAADVWDYDIYEHMKNYEKPVLLLHGSRDGIVPDSYSENASNAFPNAEYHIIKGAGHGFTGRSLTSAVSYMESYLKNQLKVF